jgi:apolipoprotein D and lipocalin family protein
MRLTRFREGVMHARVIVAGLGLAVFLSGCMAMGGPTRRAPEPLKAIDAGRFYSGLWHEIARRPMAITDGCVAGATEYKRDAGAGIEVLDSCRMGTPAGELKTIGGPGRILDPGTNAKLRVDYRLYGFIPVTRDYWVLDRANDYSWFISADPEFRDLYIFSRNPQIGEAQRRRLVGRARALGYDVTKLEFPEMPPR